MGGVKAVVNHTAQPTVKVYEETDNISYCRLRLLTAVPEDTEDNTHMDVTFCQHECGNRAAKQELHNPLNNTNTLCPRCL